MTRAAAATMLTLLTLIALVVLSGCKEASGSPGKRAPLVTVVTAAPHHFVDRIDAVGTARANEQVTLSAPVTERLEQLYFDDGDHVTRGRVIAVLAQGQEQAVLAAALAAEREAETQLRRVQALSTRGFVAGAMLDQQTATAARARSEADNARAQIADRVIRAPFSGLVSLRAISRGAVVNAGAPIATISDITRIKLDFTVPETALAAIKVGQQISATAAAYPDVPVSGRVTAIDPVIDPETRAAMVRAVLPNPGARLKPGMLLTVALSASSYDAPALPEQAVMNDGTERFVFVVDAANIVKRAKVTTGKRDGGTLEVRGLAPGARVISEGVVKVAEGMTVEVGPADAQMASGT